MTKSDGNNGGDPKPSPEDSVERAFELLKEAKALESSSEYWKASEIYVKAQQLLQSLADEAAQTTSDQENYEEQQQIAKLYSDKAQEYFSQSRQCLIQAMEQEKKQDDTADKTAGPSCSSIDDDQAKTRNQTFTTLFSRPIAAAEVVPEVAQKDMIDQQWSIEERLQELNKSLPSGFKTDDERIAEINLNSGVGAQSQSR